MRMAPARHRCAIAAVRAPAKSAVDDGAEGLRVAVGTIAEKERLVEDTEDLRWARMLCSGDPEAVPSSRGYRCRDRAFAADIAHYEPPAHPQAEHVVEVTPHYGAVGRPVAGR